MKFITSLSLFTTLSLTVPLSAHPISPGKIASREPQSQVDWQKVDYGNKRGIAGRGPQVDWTPIIYDKRDDNIHDRPVHGPGGGGPLPPLDGGNKRGITGRDPQVDWTPVIYDKRDDQIHDRPVHGPGGGGPLPPRDGGKGSVVSGRDAQPQVKWEPVAY